AAPSTRARRPTARAPARGRLRLLGATGSQPAYLRLAWQLACEEDLVGQPLLDDFAIQLGGAQQLLVVALGEDPAAVEHHDLVGERDRREAVGDDERRAPGHGLVERELDRALGGGVDRRCG